MYKRLAVGVLAAALLASGMLMGVSYAGSTGIVEPQVIALHLGDVPGSHIYPLKDDERDMTGQLWFLREKLLDADGNSVGNLTSSFLTGDGVATQDVATFTLKPGPHTEAGTIALMGNFKGFNGESMAVVGGTGAYANVRGSATLTLEDDGLTYTLDLIP